MDYSFSVLLLADTETESSHMDKHIGQLFPQISSNSISQLRKSVPMQLETSVHGHRVRLTLHYHEVTEESSFENKLADYCIAALIFLVPATRQQQEHHSQFVKPVAGVARRLFLPLMATYRQDAPHDGALVSALKSYSVAAYLAGPNIVEMLIQQLIDARVSFRSTFLDNLGGDYTVIYNENKRLGGKCRGM